MHSLVADEFNRAGGIPSGPLKGMKVKIVWGDWMTRTEVAVSETERMITEEKVNFVVGYVYSSATKAVLPVVDRYQVPLVSDVPSSPSLNRLGAKWYFRPNPHDEISVKTFFLAMKDFIAKTGDEAPNLALVYANDEFGLAAAQAAKKWNADPEIGGYNIVAEVPIPSGPSDVTSETMTLAAAKPDWIVFGSHEIMGYLLPKTMALYDVYVKAIFDSGSTVMLKGVKESGGNFINYECAKAAYNWDVKGALSEKWDGLFFDKYGYHIAEGRYWPPLPIIFKVVEKAGTLDPQVLQKTLYDIVIPAEELITTYGVDFKEPDTDEPGMNRLAAGVVTQVFPPDQDAFTVWPFEGASKEAVYPMPPWAERGI